MASSSNGESLTFLCIEVIIDRRKLLPSDPAVNFVFLRINANRREMSFVYKDMFDPLAEVRELIFRWEHIIGTLTIRQPFKTLIVFKFNRNLCGHSVCFVIVSNLVIERLSAAVDLMYFTMMRTRYGFNYEQARERVRDIYIECDGFGDEEDFPIPEANNLPANDDENMENLILLYDLDSSTSTQSSAYNEERCCQRPFNESVSVSQPVIDDKMKFVNECEVVAQLMEENTEQVVPVDENETVVQQAIEEIEPMEVNDSIVEEAVEENAEKESPVSCDENDAEEK